MSNDELIRAFAEKLETRVGMYDRQFAERAPIQREFSSEIEAEWRKVSKKNFKMTEAPQVVPDYHQIHAKYAARANEVKIVQAQERAKRDTDLQELAEQIVITDAMRIADKTLWVQYDERSTSDYHTQGFGAVKYAQAAAEDLVDHVRACGVDAEIRRVDREPTRSSGWSMESVSFPIFAACDATTCEIIRRKSPIPLRDWVKNCWKRGIQPRVMNPFLPPGFEEQNGLDYFGRETTKA